MNLVSYKFTFIFIITIFLGGCAATLHEGPKFTPAPSPTSKNALLYIYRNGGGPLYRSPDITINENKFTELPNLGYAFKYLPQGTYTIKSNWPWDIPGLDKEFEVTLVAGNTYYLRMSGDVEQIVNGVVGFGSFLKLIPADIANNEITHCAQIETDGLSN